MIYHGAFDATRTELQRRLEATGEVVPQWAYTMYSRTHSHSTTHEVLGVVAEQAQLCFGGEGGPGRFEPTVRQGDLIVVSAGVGHRLLRDLGEQKFQTVGSYPAGKHWDMCYREAGEQENIDSIHDLAWFQRDPLYGDLGPALQV
ncbi:hypothetical protein N7539_002375 [Penicillium diatomitis]|uniref:Uncharacterized protein n=1 Tax=Penicillium diatomitis TaxID=2819901 RepID=A0A9W9XFI4_9EURO|nr:uncharacterized protein N7539_002375 [Penicillium diatomitis]KAJ5490808.1 hypothetical protein N7539_002375 [Penicillium diatomitis]